MKAVITGDIINSRNVSPKKALEALKRALGNYGSSPTEWEIYRGDSFQLLLADPAESLKAVMRIKASLKTEKSRDVRMAIGIGDIAYRADAVTESNGSAFRHSGEKFEILEKEKVNLAIRSPWSDFDEEMNLYFRFALVVMDNWSEASAEFMNAKLANERLSQHELAELLGINQSSVSERKKRAYYDQLSRLDKRFRNRLEGVL